MLNRKQMEDLRAEIMRATGVWGGSISVYGNGRFEIRDINESDINRVYAFLMRWGKVHNLYRTHRYDFTHLDYTGKPKTKYTVIGDCEIH